MHWFTFNFADIFISIGIFAMVIKEFLLKKNMKYFKIILIFVILIAINGCGNFRDAVTGQTKND